MHIKKVIMESELFKGLPDSTIDEIVLISEEVHFDLGTTIIRKGEKGNLLYLITSGKVSLEFDVSDDASEPVLLNQISKNGVFGEMCLLDKYWRTANAVALDNTSVLKMAKEDLASLFKRNPEAGYIVMRNMANILSDRLVTTNLHLLKASTPSISD